MDDALQPDPRRACRLCGAALRNLVVDLGTSPLANHYLAASELDAMEPTYPLRLFVCDTCWLVQLPAAVRPEAIFAHYAYFSSYSDSWLKHAEGFANAIVSRLGLTSAHRVVEIASNDGYLLQYFMRQGVSVLGVEPAANVAAVAQTKGIPTVARFFGRGVADDLHAEGYAADLLVGNNVLAHVPDLNDFVAGLERLLKPAGVVTMEFPHLMRLIDGNEFDTIYHEHFSYFSFVAAERAFRGHGMRIFDVDELASHGGSLRIYACHEDDVRAEAPSVGALRGRERASGLESLGAFRAFGQRIEHTKRALLSFLIAEREAGHRVAAYGAPAKATTLLSYCGIRSDLIEFTVDRNPHKQGHFLPGSRIPILAPDAIAERRPDVVLILPWNLRREIIGQMAHVREWGGRFVVAIPGLEVVA